jgi:hypothetical protein
MTRRRRRRFSLSAVLAATLMLTAGCGDREPVGAELRTGLRVGEVAHAITAPTGFSAGTYARTIGPDGGVLHFGVGRLEFPAGALDRPTTITATVDGATIGAVFSPHGVNFPSNAQPLLLLDDPGYYSWGSKPQIVYIDSQGVILELIDTKYDALGERAVATLRHFSPYILAQN